MKKILALLMTAGLLFSANPGKEDNGLKDFLVRDELENMVLRENEEEGFWEFSSDSLTIQIHRYRETPDEKHTLEYCVAEVRASESSPLFSIMTPGNRMRPGGYHLVYAEDLVRDNPVVFAVSDDYYGYRQYRRDLNKAKWPTGIILRNGEILYRDTRNSANKRPFPPLDTLAVYRDGSMKTFLSDEYKAEDYLAQGALQVFSFGPWLIRDGKINEKEAGSEAVYLNYSEPRCAVGMVEPYHYIFVVVGVPDGNKYIGARGSWLIAKMQEYGCTEALNLDGGGTACMVFNGKVIIQGRFNTERRPLGSMIAFGRMEPDIQAEEQK